VQPGNTWLPTSEKFSAYKGTPLSAKEATKYQSIMGGLQYLTLTRTDLSFLVNKVCRFLYGPTTNHMRAVKRIFRYVQGTIIPGLCDNHLRNEGSVASRSIVGFSVKRECTNTHTKHANTISEVRVNLLQLMFIVYNTE
jgi:hypothetical protein